jgi:hypothetical protein
MQGRVIVERGILTVGEFRKLLAKLPDDTQMVIANDGGWYDNIGEVQLPNGEEYCALTFSKGESFDSRQY